MPRCRIIPLVLALAIGATSSAQAQEGVFVDPDSPSGKEYAIPLETARRQADPRSSGTQRVAPGRRDESPLFGEGIEAGDGGGGSNGSSGARGGSSGAPARDDATAPVRRAAPATVRAAVSRPGSPDGGLGTALTVGGGAALVLLAGGLAGLAMRRSRGQAS